MAVINYIIADDHKIFRHGLKMVLAEDEKLKLVGEAADGKELLALLERQRADVILLDLNMPGMGGVEALAAIRAKDKFIKVLILTMYDDEHFILHLMENGANGFLLKNTEPDEIAIAIRTVYEQDYYFNDLVGLSLLKKIGALGGIKSTRNNVKLNERESKVLQLICQEYTAAEIAAEIYLSPRTVEGIRAALLEKTNSKNIAGLVLYAVKNGIIPSTSGPKLN